MDNARRKWIRRLVLALLILIIGVGVAYAVVSWYILDRVERALAEKLNAKVEIDSLFYLPPYGVRITGGKLVRDDVRMQLGPSTLRLVEPPVGKRPILIEHIELEEPIVLFVRQPEQEGASDPAIELDQKLSDLFRLRKLVIHDARLIYQDPSATGTAPMVWRKIDLNLNATPKGPGVYGYQVLMGNYPLIQLQSRGTIDIDNGLLDVSQIALTARSDLQTSQSSLPAGVQKLLREFQITGQLAISGSGQLPLTDPKNAKYQAQVELSKGTARLPGQVALQRAVIHADVSTAPDSSVTTIQIRRFEGGSGEAHLQLSRGRAEFDHAIGRWSAANLVGRFDVGAVSGATSARAVAISRQMRPSGRIDFAADAHGWLAGAAGGPSSDPAAAAAQAVTYQALLYPRNLRLQPPGFPQALESVGGGVIKINDGQMRVESMSARYGDDQWVLNAARVPLSGGAVRIEDINGSIHFAQPSPEYPRGLRATVKALNPAQTFQVQGWYEYDKALPKPRYNCELTIASEGAAFAPTEFRIPMTQIRGEALLTRGNLDLRSFQAAALGGDVSARGRFDLVEPRTYEGSMQLRQIDMTQLSRMFILPTSNRRELSGRGFADVKLSGNIPDADLRTLKAQGSAEILDGDFFVVPVLKQIVSEIPGLGNAATAGEAAARGRIEAGVVHLDRAAISSPAIGLQGRGAVSFDKELKLSVVAAPLADWRQKLQKTNIPIVSDVTGEIAGAIQRVINAATRGLLYEFRVEGTTSQPQITPIPTPVLTDTAAAIFGTMLSEKKEKRLSESLK